MRFPTVGAIWAALFPGCQDRSPSHELMLRLQELHANSTPLIERARAALSLIRSGEWGLRARELHPLVNRFIQGVTEAEWDKLKGEFGTGDIEFLLEFARLTRDAVDRIEAAIQQARSAEFDSPPRAAILEY